MTIEATQQEFVANFALLEDEFDRYDYLISLALSEKVSFDPLLRRDENKIAGCQSHLWATVKMKAGRLEVNCDSDALIIKGLAILIAKIYNGRAPAEVIDSHLWFWDEIRLESQLSVDRKNGLLNLITMIRKFAQEMLTIS